MQCLQKHWIIFSIHCDSFRKNCVVQLRKLYNEELRDLLSSLIIVDVTEEDMVGEAFAAHGEQGQYVEHWAWKPEEAIWEGNIRMHILKIRCEGVDWLPLVHNDIDRRQFMNIVIRLRNL
jgi:hypothetical protein